MELWNDLLFSSNWFTVVHCKYKWSNINYKSFQICVHSLDIDVYRASVLSGYCFNISVVWYCVSVAGGVLFFHLCHLSPLLIIYFIDFFLEIGLFDPLALSSWSSCLSWQSAGIAESCGCTQQWHPLLSRPCCYRPDFFYITNSAQKYMIMGHAQKMTTVSMIRSKIATIFLFQIISSVL